MIVSVKARIDRLRQMWRWYLCGFGEQPEVWVFPHATRRQPSEHPEGDFRAGDE